VGHSPGGVGPRVARRETLASGFVGPCLRRRTLLLFPKSIFFETLFPKSNLTRTVFESLHF
jgi:hypothetical protein